MLSSYLDCIPISIIIFCVLNIKKKDYFWNLLISIACLPFLELILASINSTLYGSGLVGDSGGIDSGIFTMIMLLLFFWYIYIGAIILLIFSIIKKVKNINKKKKLNIIEKALMISLIMTNIVFLINWFSVEITYRPLFLYRSFNSSKNIYYGIGVTVEKLEGTAISYYTDLISLITFLCIIFGICFLFLKIREKRSDNYKND